MGAEVGAASTLRDYLSVVRRRKWTLIIPVLLAPIIAVLLVSRQPIQYTSSAQVFVPEQDLPANLLGDVNQSQDPVRLLATDAQFATLPQILSAALRAAGDRRDSPNDLLNASSVTPSDTADFLTFGVTEPSSRLAERLATEYANQFVIYRRQYETSQLQRAAQAIKVRLQALASQGGKSLPLYASLQTNANQLTAAAAVAASAGSLVSASTATRNAPDVTIDAVIALVLALVTGIGVAFVRDSLDPRIRSADELENSLQLRLLARLPRPPRTVRRSDRLVMGTDPDGPYAEPFRMLRTSLEFLIDRRLGEDSGPAAPPASPRRPGPAYSLMVTSAIEGEGKSTTVANLAVAFARAGRRVVLIDLDLRRPSLDRFFGVRQVPGLMDVVAGSLPAAAVAYSVDIGARSRSHGIRQGGSLFVVPLGTAPPIGVEVTSAARIQEVMREFGTGADLVLIDCPPLLWVGGALALTAMVDGLLIVASLRSIQPTMLKDLGRMLEDAPAAKLGFVLTGADLESGYEYIARRYQPWNPKRRPVTRRPDAPNAPLAASSG